MHPRLSTEYAQASIKQASRVDCQCRLDKFNDAIVASQEWQVQRRDYTHLIKMNNVEDANAAANIALEAYI